MADMNMYHSDTSGSDTENDDDDTAPNNNNNNANATAAPSSWKGWKQRGKNAYLNGEYASALQAYSQALHRQHTIHVNNHNGYNGNTNNASVWNGGPSKLDQQILLSNMVACRLKLGGASQAEAAIATAQKCIALNDLWVKGHVRLAESYMALKRSDTVGGDYSEMRVECSTKASEALQKVVDLDPENQSARNMLTKEFRYLAGLNNNNTNTNNTNNIGDDNGVAPEPSAPPEHMDDNHYQNINSDSNNDSNNDSTNDASHRQETSAGSTETETETENVPLTDGDTDNIAENENENVRPMDGDGDTDTFEDIDYEDDDANENRTLTWKEHITYKMAQVRAWYFSLAEDDQIIVKLAIFFVVLYVAFGGRFGLEYYGKNNPGASPRSNTVYEDFYRERNERQSGQHRQSSHSNSHRESYDPYEERSRHRQSSSWSSAAASGLGGNGIEAMILVGLAAVAYIAQRFFGISPWQVLMFVNMLNNRRRGGGGRFAPRRRYGGGGGLFGGGGGFGGGFGGGGFGRRNNVRHRPGGMW